MRIPENLLKGDISTPSLILDSTIVSQRYDMIKDAFQDSHICYAVKSNPFPAFLEVLDEKGASFDVASTAEIDALLDLGVYPRNMLYNNTIKTEEEIRYAHEKGVNKFSTDALSDLKRIEKCAPGSKVFFRLLWNSESADWNLNRKFGATYDEIIKLIAAASQMRIIPYGITFHVGSQQNYPAEWERAIKIVAELFFESDLYLGVELQAIDIGGGFPVPYNHPVSDVSFIAQKVQRAIMKYFGHKSIPELYLEPGRYISAPAGIMVSTVILRATREDQEWLYLDTGIYNGLIECLGEAIKYPMLTEKDGEKYTYASFVIAGRTCDSIDILYEKNPVMLPSDIQEGDKIYFLNAGAYTLTTASEFNGFSTPTILAKKFE